MGTGEPAGTKHCQTQVILQICCHERWPCLRCFGLDSHVINCRAIKKKLAFHTFRENWTTPSAKTGLSHLLMGKHSHQKTANTLPSIEAQEATALSEAMSSKSFAKLRRGAGAMKTKKRTSETLRHFISTRVISVERVRECFVLRTCASDSERDR